MKLQFNHSYNVDNRYRGLEAPTQPLKDNQLNHLRKAQDNLGPLRFLSSYVNTHRDHLEPPKSDYSDRYTRVGDSFGKNAAVRAENILERN
tara:strand:+ start:292 stop:564 length:273 start_codon:yes stop_codon:yes gene_type:complete